MIVLWPASSRFSYICLDAQATPNSVSPDYTCQLLSTRNSSVVIATSSGRRQINRVRFLPREQNIFMPVECVYKLGPAQTRSQCVRRALSLSLKQPGRECRHSEPSSANVKNNSAVKEWCLIKLKHHDTITSTFTLPTQHPNRCICHELVWLLQL
jgi:hypothetical protein